MDTLTRVNATIARWCMYIAVTGVLVLVLIIGFQVFGRYVMNDTPTWAEALALVLVLYVTLLGASAGVRDAGHIGMESLLVLAPPRLKVKLEILVHGLVALFGGIMAFHGGRLGLSVAPYNIPTLGISEGFNHLPLVICGLLVTLFSIEHILALAMGRTVVPSWH